MIENRKNQIATKLKGKQLIANPLLNKGTAFSAEERERLNLLGLIPSHVETIEEQLQRAYASFLRKESVLERYSYLRQLQDTNETLFYALLERYSAEMLPVVYTPGVGEACLEFHRVYENRLRGLYISYPDRDRIDEMLCHLSMEEVKIIVVTDGERILGLGDLGASGMGIPIGKISLYTSCGGINPAYALPIVLDNGTDNEERLKDPLYLGWRHPRVRGSAYDEFIEKFVTAVHKRYPKAMIQWEDFSKDHAHMLLERYRERVPSFNDDIQGTAAVTLAGLMSAVRAEGSSMSEQQVVILGAGSAATGIAHEIASVMKLEGLSDEEAFGRIWLISTEGLLTEARAHAKPFQKPYLQPLSKIANWDVADPRHIGLYEVVKHVRPTILIGVSTSFGAFTEQIVKEMARHVKRPIIFPLSNPFSRCEATPEDLITWTEGRALIATGTKFPDVLYKGKNYHIGQCNNYYIFPGVGLGVISSEASRVTDGMFIAAANALSEMSPALKIPGASLFPDPKEIRNVSKRIAFVVGKQAGEEGVAPKKSDKELNDAISGNFWLPVYKEIVSEERGRG